VDECDRKIATCYSSQDCMNTIGSYQCLSTCGEGFRRTPGSMSCEGTLQTTCKYSKVEAVSNIQFCAEGILQKKTIKLLCNV
jgi:hypothetical protein